MIKTAGATEMLDVLAKSIGNPASYALGGAGIGAGIGGLRHLLRDEEGKKHNGLLGDILTYGGLGGLGGLSYRGLASLQQRKPEQANIPVFDLDVPAEAKALRRVWNAERRTALDRRAAGERGPVAATRSINPLYNDMLIGKLPEKPSVKQPLDQNILTPDWIIEVLRRVTDSHER